MSIEGKVHTLLSPPPTDEEVAREEVISKCANLHKQKTFGLRPKFPPFKGWNDLDENDKPQ